MILTDNQKRNSFKRKERDLFSVKSGEKLKKIKKIKRLKSNDVNAKKKKIEYERQFKVDFERISYANITEGQLILGCIQEIHKYEMIVCLPDGIKGHLPITNISRSYKEVLSKVSEGEEVTERVWGLDELYAVGHLIITKVKNIVELPNKKIKVIVSILPEDINREFTRSQLVKGTLLQGAVTSVEEKGYVVDVGIRSVRAAFLKNDEASPAVVGVGSVFLCVVKKVLELDDASEELRIKLSATPERLSAPPPSDRKGVISLAPGVIVDAVVKEVLPVGLKLMIEDRKGFVSFDHLMRTNDLPTNYQVDQTVKARVLYITDFTAIAYCTLNPRLCVGGVIKKPMRHLKIGDVIENAEIYKSSFQGIHLLLPHNCHGFCPLSNFRESKMSQKELTATFPVGARKTCRIVGVSVLDQVFIVSLRKSILSEKVFGGEDLAIGQTLKVKIVEHKDTGTVVSISNLVKGFIPSLHLTDASTKNLERKYPVGKTFKAKIIRHIPGEDPHLTLKSDLLRSNLPIVSNFEQSNVGVTSLGSIAKIFPKSVLLEFYNGAKAVVPVRYIPPELRNLETAFRVGQIVKCKIISVDTPNQKIFASLDIVKTNVTSKSTKALSLGSIVEYCKVTGIQEEKVMVSIGGKNTEAYIPKYHLADDVKLSHSIFSLLQEGDVIRKAVLFAKENAKFILSLKASILQYVHDPKNYAQKWKFGHVFPSVVVEISEDKVQVSALKGKFNSKVCILKRNLMKAAFKKISHAGFHIGQTLFVKYLTNKNNLIQGSSHLLKVLKNQELSSLQLLYNTIVTEKQIQAALDKVVGAKFNEVKIGESYSGEVIALFHGAALVNISSLGLDGIIHQKHFKDDQLPVLNARVTVRVLCIDYKNNCLQLTAKYEDFRLSSDHQVEVGQEHLCEVLLAKREFILGQLKNSSPGPVVYLPAKRHINDIKGRHSFYEVGQKYKIKIKYIEESLILADLIHHCQAEDTQPLNLSTQLPKIDVQKAIPQSALGPLILNETILTHSDFLKRAKQKIAEVLQFVEPKRKIKKIDVTSKSRLKQLKEDNFPQFDEEFYWHCVALERKEKKKLKSCGLKVVKRKQEDLVDNKDVRPKKRKRLTEGSQEKDEDVLSENTSCLKINSSGFDWSGTAMANEANSSSEETGSENDESVTPWKSVKRLSKFERDERARAEERKTRELELQRLDPDRPPETALDYEEKVERNPHSSAVWIEYVSFHLENAETEKARMVAERALKRIPATMENERLAIWNVILRLEVMFGSPDSVQEAFKEAIATNDELKIFYLIIDIYANATKIKEGEEVIHRMTKKYSQSPEVWIKAGLFYFKAKQLSEARKILDRALVSLPKGEHIDIINRFAQFELKFGDFERGKTIFEKLLSNFPKRLDIWNVYADSLRKHNDIPGTRNVLERMTGLKLRMKAMRSVFKKLLEFEKEYGTPQQVEAVKLMVEKYVEMALKEED